MQQQHLASAMSSSASMQQQKTTSTSFSSSMSSASSQQQQSFVQQGSQALTQQKKVLQQQPQQVAAPVASIKHGEEIKQEDLKTTIQSAITDLEQDIDKTVVDSGDKENYAPPSIQQQVDQIGNQTKRFIRSYQIIYTHISFIIYVSVYIFHYICFR